MATSTIDFAVDAALETLGVEIDTGIEHGPADVSSRLSSNTDKKVTIYSTITGDPHLVPAVNARNDLHKRLPDGSRAFWAENMPGPAPIRVKGAVACMLHPDFDETDGPAGFDRDYIDRIGLTGRTCNMMAPDKANRGDFRSVYDRDDHMAKKHRREWRTIEAAQEQAAIDLERQERRDNTAAMMALAGQAVAAPEPTEQEEVILFPCDVSGCSTVFSTSIGLDRHRRMTRDDEHSLARGETL